MSITPAQIATEQVNEATEDPLGPIWEAIWARRPILGEIMRKCGGKNLYDYTKDFFDVNKSPLLDARKEEFFEVVHDLLEGRIGKETADGVIKQLRKLPLVSTADHHGSIDCPFWVNANIVSGIPYFEHEDSDLRYLVVFSFASVSLNNADAYPRGLVFHSGFKGEGQQIRLPLFLDKEKMGVVFGMRPFTREDLERAKSELRKRVKEGLVQADKAEAVLGLMEEYFAAPEVLSASNLCSQITRINLKMWPHIFHPVRDRIPDLIYLDIETLVSQLLLRIHFKNPESLLYRFVFDSHFHTLALKHFNNINGAFSTGQDWGSFLFWALDERNQRVRLLLKENRLESPDGKFVFELTPAVIIEALEEKKIFPGMVFCYLTVALYYGMKCLGGFSQVNDLTQTKEAWQAMLRELGMNKEAEALTPVQTKELGGDGMILAYFKTREDNLVPPTGVDMILETEAKTLFEDYVEHAKALSFREMMNPFATEIYRVFFNSSERNLAYMTLSPDMILDMTGLKKKLLDWSCLDQDYSTSQLGSFD